MTQQLRDLFAFGRSWEGLPDSQPLKYTVGELHEREAIRLTQGFWAGALATALAWWLRRR
jgi:hypothetical protein